MSGNAPSTEHETPLVTGLGAFLVGQGLSESDSAAEGYPTEQCDIIYKIEQEAGIVGSSTYKNGNSAAGHYG